MKAFFQWLLSFFSQPPSPPSSLTPRTNLMPWMRWMEMNIGQTEISTAKLNNSFIVNLFKNTSYKTNFDETPWCAACVCTALEETGYKHTRSAAAKSYDNYGSKCELQPGCIVTLRHPSGGRHVGFCHHVIDEKTFAMIGGNQSNQLKITVYNRSEIVACRWPETK